jgi:hypothetical protein
MRAQEGRPAWNTINRADFSAVAVRSVAAALQGVPLNIWDITPKQGAILHLISLLGKRAAIAAVEHFTSKRGIDPSWASRITTDDLASWAISHYQNLEGPWDAVIIGVPNGGIVHLAMALGVPFLPQNFLTSYRHAPIAPDNVKNYQDYGAGIAKQVIAHNHDLAVINHYDPLHDRIRIKYVNHIRYKLLDLPKAYQSFIHDNVRRGGIIFFSDCRYSWPMYFIDERQWFQVGGLGGVRPREFIQGHPEIADMQRRADANPLGHWGLTGRMAFEMPESEWGMMPPLREITRRFAHESEYRFEALDGAHPQDFSRMAFSVWQKNFKRAGIVPQGVLIETLTQIAPLAPRAGGLLPLWLPGNSEDSLIFLHKMRRKFPDDKPVLWLPMPNFTEPFDLVPWERWLEILDGLEVHALGMHQHQYPTDARAVYRGHNALMQWLDAHPISSCGPASCEIVVEEARAARVWR